MKFKTVVLCFKLLTCLIVQRSYAFHQKIQQRVLGPGESAAGVMYLSMRKHPKSCCNFPLKVAAT